MKQRTKQIIFLVGSIFVALIFLSSYAAFSNNGGSSTSTSTIKNVLTFPSFGSSNAVITNYSDIGINITLLRNSNATRTNVTNFLSALQANGTVQSYVYQNGSYAQIVLSGMSAYQLQQQLYKLVNGSANSIEVGATTDIRMPNNITLYYNNVQPITVYLPIRNYTIRMKNVKSVGTVINLGTSALLARNGSIYGSLRVSYSN